jgi:hypothetical protein
MVRLPAFFVAALLVTFVADVARAQNSYRGSTPAEIKERFRTDAAFAARYPNFDRVTPGVIPAGAKEPNRAPTGALPPPGDKVYWRHGAEATNCSSRVVNAGWPDGVKPTRLFTCVQP